MDAGEEINELNKPLERALIDETNDLLKDEKKFPIIDVDEEVNKLKEDPLVRHISERYGIDGNDVLKVKNHPKIEKRLDEINVVKQAAFLKKGYGMNNYLNNAHLILERGYEQLKGEVPQIKMSEFSIQSLTGGKLRLLSIQIAGKF